MTDVGQSARPLADIHVKFWEQQGIYVERLSDDGLRIWVEGKQVFLTAERAESLLQWMDRSR